MLRVHHLGLAALALPLMAAASPTSAATSAEVGWRQIDCDRSQLELFDWMQCRISADTTVEKNLHGTARHYVTLGGTSDAAAGMVLSVPQNDGYFSNYPPSESEMAIRTTVAGAGRKVDQWGPYRGFDRTGYMTFVSDGMNCVGFDHGGRYKRDVTSDPGYLFLLRGYFCEKGPIPDPQARLIDYLEATRVGPEFLQRNALGDRVRSLNVPAWRVSAVMPAPAVTVVPQPVIVNPVPGAVVIGQPAVTTTPVVAVVPTAQSLPTRVTWAGMVSQGSAQITPLAGGRSATLSYGAADAAISCNGQLNASNGAIGIGTAHSGTWTASCNNGEWASGTYSSDYTGRGIGRGTDRLGRSVELAFGG
jgi:hypothetical protein